VLDATAWLTLPTGNVTISQNIGFAGPAHAHHDRVEVSNASGTAHGADRTGRTS
jgi:hypothetical protein